MNTDLHKVTGNKCGTAGTAGLAMNVDAVPFEGVLRDESYTSIHLVLRRRRNQVNGAELLPRDSDITPLLQNIIISISLLYSNCRFCYECRPYKM